MRFIEDFSDERNKAWCIHCWTPVSSVPSNRDHVPSKCLLSRALREKGALWDAGEGGEDDYLPQVVICKRCNSGFSKDETYLLCVLHAVVAGGFSPDKTKHPEAAKVLRSNRHIVRLLRAASDPQLSLFKDSEPFTVYPDMTRIQRVVVKNARGHAYHEMGEPLHDPPSVTITPLSLMTDEARAQFESVGDGQDVWPEVGSRMTVWLVDDQALAGGWIQVEAERYRYAIDWTNGVTVRSVIWDYLATETRWAI